MARNCVAFAFATLLLTAGASAAEWRVVQSTGDIWIGSDAAQRVSLSSVETVPNGATLITGQNGRAMLSRGTQTMLVGPNSVITVPTTESEEGFATVLQRAGQVEFDIDHQTTQHFAVETPYLAAVVKGTHFTVSIEGDSAAVSVDRGLVGVTDLATGERADTPAGQKARVSGPASQFSISGLGTLAMIVPGSARPPVVQAVSAQELDALQAKVPDGSGSGGNNVINGAALGVTASSGGNDGGGPGGTIDIGSSGTTGGNASVDLGNSGVSPSLALNDPLAALRPTRTRSSQDDDPGIPALAIAIGIAFSAMLAFGFAYLRGRAG